MMTILDVHTHLPAPRPGAVISCTPDELPPQDAFPEQLYSVGIHPWDVTPAGISIADTARLREELSRPDVVAVGETGIDLARKDCAPLFAQMLAFRAHIKLSEELSMPMIIHCVKAHDIIIGLRHEMKPAQRWLIHGFRGKPSILAMLLAAGIDVSYGPLFNADSVAATPADRLFAETDESDIAAADVISRLADANPAASEAVVASNAAGFFSIYRSIN